MFIVLGPIWAESPIKGVAHSFINYQTHTIIHKEYPFQEQPNPMIRRSMNTAATAVVDGGSRLTRFSLHPPKSVEVEFANGRRYNLSAEFLRVHSPAADSKIRSVGGEKVISGRRHVGIMSAEPVGNYGVRLLFDDLHKTGIYTWDYFYNLGDKKFSLMRSYIETLRRHGLSRDPRAKKVTVNPQI